MAKKKKMTPAQAAAARRPDDWVAPESAKPAKEKAKKPPATSSGLLRSGVSAGGSRRMAIGFIILFVAMAIVAPFIVIFVSGSLGISGI